MEAHAQIDVGVGRQPGLVVVAHVDLALVVRVRAGEPVPVAVERVLVVERGAGGPLGLAHLGVAGDVAGNLPALALALASWSLVAVDVRVSPTRAWMAAGAQLGSVV